MIISASAYLVLCECGAHGHIVLADGSRGEEFVSKESGIAEIVRLRGEDRICVEEEKHLRHQIGIATDLAFSDDRAHILARLQCFRENELREIERRKSDAFIGGQLKAKYRAH